MKEYQIGKLGIAEGIGLVLSLVIARLFLTGMSDVVRENGQILWLAMIIYTTIPLLIVYMLVYVNNSVDGNIFAVYKFLVGKGGAWVIVLAYSGMFIGNSALLLRQYAEYTLITALPQAEFQLVIVWYAATAGIMCYLGIEALCRTSYLMLPLLLGGFVVVFVMVNPFYIIYHLVPWQGNGIVKAIYSGITSVGFNLGVLSVIFLSTGFQNDKTIKSIATYALGGALVLRIVFMLVYIMVFGVAVGGEKAMPFFELTRLVHLSQFIQRIEALFIVVWVISGLLAIAGSLYVGLYLMVMLLKLPTLRSIVPVAVSIIANLAMLPPDVGYTILADQMLLRISQMGIYVFPTILFVVALVKKRRRKKSCTSA